MAGRGLSAVLLLSCWLPASPPLNTRGRVLDAITGQGIPGVRIVGSTKDSGSPGPARQLQTTTDPSGNFTFPELVAAVQYERDGYDDLPPLALVGPGTGEVLGWVRGAGDMTIEVTRLMMPLSTVSGTVVDEKGRPVPGALVSSHVLQPLPDPDRHSNHELVYTSQNGSFTLRIYPLETELTIVDPRCGHGGLPGTPPRERITHAQIVHLAPGEVSRLRIRLTTAPAYSVTGTLRNRMAPFPEGTASLWLHQVYSDGRDRGGCTESSRNRLPQTGAFAFEGVPPGAYRLSAWLSWPNGSCAKCSDTREVQRDFTVAGGDASQLAMEFDPGADIAGVVHWETAIPGPYEYHTTGVKLVDKFGNTYQDEQRPYRPESFHLSHVQPQDYRIRISETNIHGLGPEFYLREVRFNGRPVLADAIHISPELRNATMDVYIAKAAKCKIRVVDKDRNPVHLYTAALLQRRDDGYIVSALEGVAPGEYIAIAITPAVPNIAYRPEMLARYADRGSPVTLAAGETRELEVTALKAHPLDRKKP